MECGRSHAGPAVLRRRRLTTGLLASMRFAVATTLAALAPLGLRAAPGEPDLHVVSTLADQGPGSLRAALQAAARTPGPDRIVFGDAGGIFSTPQTIALSAPLPVIEGDVEIDGHIPGLLWKAYGATLGGEGRSRIFEVAESGSLRLAGITLADGHAREGGGILNRGRLVLEGVTLLGHRAERDGGALANRGGEVWLINSTAADNRARRGGAVANLSGTLHIVHATLYRNQARKGAAVFSRGPLSLANSILAGDGEQCRQRGRSRVSATHNLITRHSGCGRPISQAEPGLGRFGYYNGPTPLFPVEAGSPALNLGDNQAALDARGQPLVWDQRGNGDPRYAEGYADLGAFEQQPPLAGEFVVDTIEDNGLRGCTLAGQGDCPLRAALELAIAAQRPLRIRFDPEVFAQPRTLPLAELPAGADVALVLDGSGAAAITIIIPGPRPPWRMLNGVSLDADAAVLRYGQ